VTRPDARGILSKKDFRCLISPAKIAGPSHLVFDKTDLDRVVANGDEVRRRGRPKKNKNVSFCGDSAANK